MTTAPSDRRMMAEAFEFRRQCRDAARGPEVSILEEPLMPSPYRRLCKASVYWRYRRIYGRFP